MKFQMKFQRNFKEKEILNAKEIPMQMLKENPNFKDMFEENSEKMQVIPNSKDKKNPKENLKEIQNEITMECRS